MQLSSNSHFASGLAFQPDRLITLKIFMELIIGVYYEMNSVIGCTELHDVEGTLIGSMKYIP